MNNRGPAGTASRAYARAAGRGARTTAARPVRVVPAAGPLPLRGSRCLGVPGRGCAWEGVWGRSDPRTTGRVCLAVASSTVFLGVFSAPPACLRDLIARHRASSQCCPWSGWWAPSLSADEGGDGQHGPCRLPGDGGSRQPQGAARRGRGGPAGPPPWRHHRGGDHPAALGSWNAGPERWAASSGSGSRAPAATRPGWPAGCRPAATRWWRSTDRTARPDAAMGSRSSSTVGLSWTGGPSSRW
jgi:hypothetical protein